MRILVLARLKAGSGNNSTASRIRDHLVSCGHAVPIKCVSFYRSSKDLNDYVCANEVDAVLGIHAFRAGKLLHDCGIPYVIVFGGTDLNEHFSNEEKFYFMTNAVIKAMKCIAFNTALCQRAVSLWKDVEQKIVVQPQAVEIFPSNFTWSKELGFTDKQYEMILNNNAVVFLLVAGLRPVKDPCYLIDTFSEWHDVDNRIHLLVIGPEIDISYSVRFKNCVKNSSGVIFINGMSTSDLQGLMTKAFALVNSSKSEGMANSILEAMNLGLPVLARMNDGNAAIVEHRKTGLLFHSPKEFRNLAEEILERDELKNQLTENAKKYVLEEHSFEKERSAYRDLINSLFHN